MSSALTDAFYLQVSSSFCRRFSTAAKQKEKSSIKSRGYWKKLENQRKFFDSVYHKLSLKGWEDWYNVENSQVLVRINSCGLTFSNMGATEFWIIMENRYLEL